MSIHRLMTIACASLIAVAALPIPAAGGSGALQAQRTTLGPVEGFLTDYDEALRQSKASGKPVMLDIYATWCGYCRKLREETYTNREVRELFKEFITVSVDGEKNRHLMQKYEVQGFPTIVFHDPNGHPLLIARGFVPRGDFADRMRQALERNTIASRMLKELRDNPDSLSVNFRAGVYYSEANNHVQAREFFLRAWNSRTDDAPQRRADSIFNAAVSSMQLGDYTTAVSHWNIYISLFKESPIEHNLARFYRGVAQYHIGNRDAARSDLEYSTQHLHDEESRSAARRYLDSL